MNQTAAPAYSQSFDPLEDDFSAYLKLRRSNSGIRKRSELPETWISRSRTPSESHPVEDDARVSRQLEPGEGVEHDVRWDMDDAALERVVTLKNVLGSLPASAEGEDPRVCCSSWSLPLGSPTHAGEVDPTISSAEGVN